MSSIIPTLAVADIVASMRFYTETLGFTPGGSLPDDTGTLVHGSVTLGESMIMFALIDPASEHDRAPRGKGVTIYTTVADDQDIDALYQHAERSGASIVQEPTDQFWGHRDWGVTDPDGYLVFVSKVVAHVTEEGMREALAGAPA